MSGLRSIGLDQRLKTRNDAVTVREVVGEDRASALALGMRDLYMECVSRILKDDSVRFHVIMMPSMTGDHYTYCMNDEEDMCHHVAELLNVDINHNDCVVVLGRDFLGNEISEDDMLQTVITDLALHLARISPVTERETGWYGKYIGWAAVASVVSAAHPIIRALGATSYLNDCIKNAANKSILAHQTRASEFAADLNRCAFEAIERVCDLAHEECGGYISLPTTAAEISEVATAYYHEAVNSMAMVPRVIS